MTIGMIFVTHLYKQRTTAEMITLWAFGIMHTFNCPQRHRVLRVKESIILFIAFFFIADIKLFFLFFDGNALTEDLSFSLFISLAILAYKSTSTSKSPSIRIFKIPSFLLAHISTQKNSGAWAATKKNYNYVESNQHDHSICFAPCIIPLKLK